jgi:N-acetyl-anhydromuramyl-L-alanine amidase AmpD
MYSINWRGDKCKNYYTKRNKILGFCDHITAGTRQSVYYWFNSPNNNVGSSHYVVCRDGSIDQYVDISRSAWTQGIAGDAYNRAIAPIVRDNRGINPNFYLIGIEYEGYLEGHVVNGEVIIENFGLDGSITDDQFYAGCWLKKYLQEEIEQKYGHRIPLVRYNIEQHRRIDPKRKPNCPGDNFPVERQLAELAIADKMTLEEYEERLEYIKNPSAKVVRAFSLADRVRDLYNRRNHPKYGKECIRKLLMLSEVTGKSTPQDIYKRVMDLYNKSQSGEFQNEANRKLKMIGDVAEERGIL